MTSGHRRQRDNPSRPPEATGLYHPDFEHDSCGVGFVAHIKGERSHQIVLDADHLLCRMDHRGARGAEPNTGDGAGILTALPHEFLARIARESLGAELPAPGRFAAGNVFLPTDSQERISNAPYRSPFVCGPRSMPYSDRHSTAETGTERIERCRMDFVGDRIERHIRVASTWRLRMDGRITRPVTVPVSSAEDRDSRGVPENWR
jgi:glutamate synthase domain-containing protein 1